MNVVNYGLLQQKTRKILWEMQPLPNSVFQGKTQGQDPRVRREVLLEGWGPERSLLAQTHWGRTERTGSGKEPSWPFVRSREEQTQKEMFPKHHALDIQPVSRVISLSSSYASHVCDFGFNL